MVKNLPVGNIVGVGKSKAAVLAEMGIYTVADLLHNFPLRYEDRSIKPYEAFTDGAQVSARAVIEGEAKVRWNGKRSVVSASIRVDQRVRLTGMWFNQPYIRQKLTDGRPIVVYGRFDAGRRLINVNQTDFSLTAGQGAQGSFAPVYRSAQGLSSTQLHAMIDRALKQYGDEQLEDVLPHALREKYRLLSHAQAVRAMHFPQTADELHQAHRRLSFEEFFLFQVQLQWFRARQKGSFHGTARNLPDCALERFTNCLPHPLTGAQMRACQQVGKDLRAQRAMARLLQGDVGSGKTWVAFWAAYAVASAGAQSALMAPTEILAEQHFRNAQAVLNALDLRVRLLTGSTKEAERKACLDDLQAGRVDLLVGTHALLTESVGFSNLGLVITDEQHRFGVSQRSVLRDKGNVADVLMLTATPIPRTLALAVYGDLDVSVLDELPAGRLPVRTQWLSLNRADEAIRLARRHLARGRQVYVVAPLVEASEQLADISSATELADELQEEFAGYKVALLHGRMKAVDKDCVMRAFLSGQVQVLVSTTVIEVGIDVKAASAMLIYHAERFGLAQLHQLRGRVGRGDVQSDCVLLSNAEGEMAKARLQTLVETSDGFVIAERDMELRGPGEFLGLRQSGLPEFTVGDLTRDLKVMEVAREEASQIVSDPGFWLLPQYEKVRDWMQEVPHSTYYRV